ncbi:MAG TPA: patatin-like phospholipase family protein [Candidatus Sulfomarinibacteraceae bacterium]|nr:patatin-like phospholipase family protein [Candidatus Sulfomarinibacteraceae bacterium]
MAVNRVSLALGGGADKGLAHVGVLQGLAEDGVEVAGVAGTSMGAIVGALVAQGLTAAQIAALFRAVDWVRLGRIMVASVSGTAFSDMVRESFGGIRIEELPVPYAAVCCDLDTGEMVSLTSGDLADAVTASAAIPGILPLRSVNGRRLVDGAVVEPVPVTAATSLTDAPVLAINVVRPAAPDRSGGAIVTSLPLKVELPSVVGRIERWLRRQRDTGDPDGIQSRLSRWETVMRSFHIMQYRLATCGQREVATVEPPVGSFGWFDFHRVDEIVDAGYRAYRAWAETADAADGGPRGSG